MEHIGENIVSAMKASGGEECVTEKVSQALLI